MSAKKQIIKQVPQTKISEPKTPHIITDIELLPDGELLLEITIPTRPMTKKTHQRIVRRGGFNRILPSKQYEEYEAFCKSFCESVWKDLGNVPMDFGVSVSLKIYLNTWVIGDECGYMQSLGDVLEKWGVIANDKFIHWDTDGSMIAEEPDKNNPRAEIIIKRFRHPYETFRAKQEESELRKRERAEIKANKIS